MSKNPQSPTDPKSQSTSWIILRSWKAGSEEKVNISKKLGVFEDPKESITLNTSLSFADSTDAPTTLENNNSRCNYNVSLTFNTDVGDLKEKCTYVVSFNVKKSADNETSSFDKADVKLLFECEQVRTSNSMEFSGKFVADDLFLTKCDAKDEAKSKAKDDDDDDDDDDLPVINYRLYLRLKRYNWQLGPEKKPNENVAQGIFSAVQSKNDQADRTNPKMKKSEHPVRELNEKIHQLTTMNKFLNLTRDKLQAELSELRDDKLKSLRTELESKSGSESSEVVALKKVVVDLRSTMKTQTEDYEAQLKHKEAVYDMFRGLQNSKIAKLNEEMIALKETEHNLLAHLQESEQRNQKEAEELKGKIKQLEMSAEDQRIKHETQIDEFKCCVCCVNGVNIVWIPCGHAKFCEECVNDRRRGDNLNDCMICRQPGQFHKIIL